MAYEIDPVTDENPAESEPGRGVTHVEVTADDAGTRLDNFLVRQLKDVPRTHVFRLLRKGEVRLNGKRVSGEVRVAEGDVLRVPPVRIEAPVVGGLLLAGGVYAELLALEVAGAVVGGVGLVLLAVGLAGPPLHGGGDGPHPGGRS